MDYVIIVNDNGELKTISATELKKFTSIDRLLQGALNSVLDERSAAEEDEAKVESYNERQR